MIKYNCQCEHDNHKYRCHSTEESPEIFCEKEKKFKNLKTGEYIIKKSV